MQDSELLLQFTQGSEKAFAELVRRHVDLVFAAALRHAAGDRHRAEDIVQQVFIDLARKAGTLGRHPTLAGWLHASTRFTARNLLRREWRRAAREKQSEIMPAPGTEPRWENIRPVIDDALLELDEDDRQSVLLRFFGRQPFAAIADQLGISENAAQKRVDRALDRLNLGLKRRGIASTAAALSLALGESAVAAPVALAGTVTTAALARAAGLAAGAAVLGTGWKIALVAATAVAVGWVGMKWAAPAGGAPGPRLADAGPRRVEVAATSPASADAPMAVGPVSGKPAAAPAPPPAAAAERKSYVVHAGDTLKRIATAAGVSAEAVRAENPGYDFVRMRVGELVRLPANALMPAPVARAPIPIPPDQLYLVQPGDTLLSIARKRDLLPDELRTLNPGTNWQQLRVGQPIRAP